MPPFDAWKVSGQLGYETALAAWTTALYSDFRPRGQFLMMFPVVPENEINAQDAYDIPRHEQFSTTLLLPKEILPPSLLIPAARLWQYEFVINVMFPPYPT